MGGFESYDKERAERKDLQSEERKAKDRHGIQRWIPYRSSLFESRPAKRVAIYRRIADESLLIVAPPGLFLCECFP